MNRRDFSKRMSAFLMVLATGSLTFMTGCSLNESNVKSLINVLITSIQNILKVATGAPWAAQLTAALTALQTAEANWTPGSTTAIIDDALNTVTAILAVIPLTAVYSPLVDIIVSGIEAVLAVLPATVALPKIRATIYTNPHHGRIVLNGPSFSHPTPSGAYKHQWNFLCKETGMTQAEF